MCVCIGRLGTSTEIQSLPIDFLLPCIGGGYMHSNLFPRAGLSWVFNYSEDCVKKQHYIMFFSFNVFLILIIVYPHAVLMEKYTMEIIFSSTEKKVKHYLNPSKNVISLFVHNDLTHISDHHIPRTSKYSPRYFSQSQFFHLFWQFPRETMNREN